MRQGYRSILMYQSYPVYFYFKLFQLYQIRPFIDIKFYIHFILFAIEFVSNVWTHNYY